MMNRNEKIELTELEKARLQGRLEALEAMETSLMVSNESYFLLWNMFGKSVPNSKELASTVREIISTVTEKAFEIAGAQLAVQRLDVLSKSGLPVSCMKADKKAFRDTLNHFKTEIDL